MRWYLGLHDGYTARHCVQHGSKPYDDKDWRFPSLSMEISRSREETSSAVSFLAPVLRIRAFNPDRPGYVNDSQKTHVMWTSGCLLLLPENFHSRRLFRALHKHSHRPYYVPKPHNWNINSRMDGMNTFALAEVSASIVELLHDLMNMGA
jgi:hypothetical protein